MESEVHLGREAIQCFLEHDRLQSDAELHHASGGENSKNFTRILSGDPSLGLIACDLIYFADGPVYTQNRAL